MSFDTLAEISKKMLVTYPDSKQWEDSPFKWIKDLPCGSKGLVGKTMILELLKSIGANPTLNEDKHIIVNGRPVVPKLSLLWATGDLKFQNIRDIPNSHIFCLGLCPKSAFGWMIPSTEVWNNGSVSERAGLAIQHAGADAWLCVRPSKLPTWLSQYGGELPAALEKV